MRYRQYVTDISFRPLKAFGPRMQTGKNASFHLGLMPNEAHQASEARLDNSRVDAQAAAGERSINVSPFSSAAVTRRAWRSSDRELSTQPRRSNGPAFFRNRSDIEGRRKSEVVVDLANRVLSSSTRIPEIPRSLNDLGNFQATWTLPNRLLIADDLILNQPSSSG